MRFTLILILLGALALRLANLTLQPLWFDEGWSVWFATSDLPTLAVRTAADIHPPFYYALLHGWIRVFGPHEFSLRLLSVFIGVVTVAALYRLAKDVLGAPAAVSAALLAAAAPLYIFYAQEVRMYGLVMLLGALSSWLFWRATMRTHAPLTLWAAHALVTSAAMYTQYYAAFIPLFHFFFWLCGARRRATLRAALISFGALFVLYLPWLLYVAAQLTTYVAAKVSEEKYLPLALPEYVARHLVAFALGHLDAESAWLGGTALLFVLLALLALRDLRGAARLFLLAYLFVPMLAGYLIQLRFPFAPPRMERLLLLASPPFIMLVAYGLTRVTERISARRPLLSVAVTTAMFGVLLLASALSLARFYSVPRYSEQDYRALAARIDALALPSDVVIVVHPWQAGFLQAYLRAPVTLQMVAEPAWGRADEMQLRAALDAERRIWLPAYRALGAILETAMEKYLAQHALVVENRWHETTRLSFYAPPPPMTSAPRGINYGELALLSTSSTHTAQPAGWGIVPLQLLWRVPAAQKSSLPHLSLKLKDAAQRVWAAHDQEIALDLLNADAAQSTETITQNIGFLIPAGTPENVYQLSLLVYDPRTQQPLGGELPLGEVTVVLPQDAPPISALPIQHALSAEWPRLRLLGYTLREGAWRTGDELRADLFWQVRDPTLGEEVSILQLTDSSGQVLSRGEPPAPPAFVSRRAGDLVREQRALLIPAALAPGRYALSLVRVSDASVVQLTSGAAQVHLQTIEVVARPHQFQLPAPQMRQDFRVGDMARIVGSDFALDAAARRINLRVYWQAARETSTAYRVFVHVTRPDEFKPLAQDDSAPAAGAAPTTSWVSGEYVVDEHTIQLPANLPAGTYRVLVGLYDPSDNTRPAVFFADGRSAPNQSAVLLQFELP